MARRFITSSILFLLALGFAIGGKLYIDSQADPLILLLCKADEQVAAGDNQAAQELILQAQEKWAISKKWLSHYVMNQDLDQIEAAIKVASVAVQEDRNARVYITNSINLIRGLKDSQKISVENII